ncbi:MAG: hypothetical protein ACK4Z6_05415, partial [Candidatus Methylomirabilales bacterium]
MPDLSEDEEEIDIEGTFTAVRAETQHQRRWEVLEDVYLGTFAFLKLRLYRDVQQYSDGFLEHPIVRALAG